MELGAPKIFFWLKIVHVRNMLRLCCGYYAAGPETASGRMSIVVIFVVVLCIAVLLTKSYWYKDDDYELDEGDVTVEESTVDLLSQSVCVPLSSG